MDQLAAILIGLLGGAVAGLMGVGGGILFVPALVIFLDQSQVHAEATSLLAIIPVAIVGTWRQIGYGNVRLQHAAAIGLLSASACWRGRSWRTRCRSARSRSGSPCSACSSRRGSSRRALRWEEPQPRPASASPTTDSSPARRADSGNS